MSYDYSEDGLVEGSTQKVLEDLGWIVKYAYHKETFASKDDRSTAGQPHINFRQGKPGSP